MPSIFTRIIRRELPAHVVYEDAHTLAFLDINPKSEGHTLVVPKHEVAAFHDLPPEVLPHLAAALHAVAGAVARAMGTPHYNLSLNNGAPAGQVVFHVHFHVIPRYAGRPRGSPSGGDLERVAAAIRAAVAEGQALFE